MSIQEEAQRLNGVADRVPVNATQQFLSELSNIGAEVSSILGSTSTSGNITNLLHQAESHADALNQALQQARQAIQDAAQHHLTG
ncbi:hypothetical protein [Actinokineospora globicatena]|uniref:Uncharacterized protein n=1 Tax=Actinokineospora globicatena TaxID=103729 RepID=A0A9W6QML4_9PSEU|nr:hypothetical protein [Actinokineospora globicatena]MCP2300610.1 hypothetical protein [Actinokineospora globicatena]GLW81154.1 hypothetical protein Aglo01_56350 [Actinokineospora globicatena]GLW88347.1 hypothetical protein Aglo02_59860 [Actinokineospora globicatena]GLW92816.1 hypothetical protein Aglo03_36320 [Actinokineospora globicatena]